MNRRELLSIWVEEIADKCRHWMLIRSEGVKSKSEGGGVQPTFLKVRRLFRIIETEPASVNCSWRVLNFREPETSRSKAEEEGGRGQDEGVEVGALERSGSFRDIIPMIGRLSSPDRLRIETNHQTCFPACGGGKKSFEVVGLQGDRLEAPGVSQTIVRLAFVGKLRERTRRQELSSLRTNRWNV